MTPERIAGIGFVVLLHIVAIWAIVSGLVPKVFAPPPPPDIVLVKVPDKEVIPPPAPKMPPVNLANPTTADNVPPPLIKFQPDEPPPLQPPPRGEPARPFTPQIPDTTAIGIADTHTIPPYPANERRMGFQGTVTLHLTISPQGSVIAADIVKSSGSSGLDQAALSWVTNHWKYKPAIQNGVPAESHVDANVVFSLRNAG
jgi:protein TonB